MIDFNVVLIINAFTSSNTRTRYDIDEESLISLSISRVCIL